MLLDEKDDLVEHKFIHPNKKEEKELYPESTKPNVGDRNNPVSTTISATDSTAKLLKTTKAVTEETRPTVGNTAKVNHNLLTTPSSKLLNYSDEKQPTKLPISVYSTQRVSGSTMPSVPGMTSTGAITDIYELPDTDTSKPYVPGRIGKPYIDSGGIPSVSNEASGNNLSYTSTSKPSTHSANEQTQGILPNHNIPNHRPTHPVLEPIKPIMSNSPSYPYDHKFDKRTVDKGKEKEQKTPFGRKLWVSRIVPYNIKHEGTSRFPHGNQLKYIYFIYPSLGGLSDTLVWVGGGLHTLSKNVHPHSLSAKVCMEIF